MRSLLLCCMAALLAASGCGRRARATANLPPSPPPIYQADAQYRTVPEGSTVVLTVIDEIDAREAKPGERYSAVIARDVLNSHGKVLIGRGSPAELVAISAADRNVELGLYSVMVHGGRYLTVPANGTSSGRSPSLGERLHPPGANGPVSALTPALTLLTFRVTAPFRLQVPGEPQ